MEATHTGDAWKTIPADHGLEVAFAQKHQLHIWDHKAAKSKMEARQVHLVFVSWQS